MNWGYQITKADTAEAFQASRSKLGAAGGKRSPAPMQSANPKKVAFGQGMAPPTAVGTPMRVAVMKQAIKPAGAV